jgi:hypothetical protein
MTHDRFRPPLASARTWTAVMERAGWRCECRGQCGRPHSNRDGRCSYEHGGRHRLIAGFGDPLVSESQWTAAQLMAWCPHCFDAVRSASRKESTATLLALQLDLFAGSGEGA